MTDLNQLFEDYKPLQISSLLFYEIFFLRRYLLILTLVIIPDKVGTITAVHIYSTLFMCGYIWKFKPLITKFRNCQEFFNEFCILVTIYSLTGYTDGYNTDIGRFDSDRICYIEDISGTTHEYRNEQCAKDFVTGTTEFRHNVGIVTLSVFTLNIVVNMFFITRDVIKNLLKMGRKKYPIVRKLLPKMTWGECFTSCLRNLRKCKKICEKKPPPPPEPIVPWTALEMKNLACMTAVEYNWDHTYANDPDYGGFAGWLELKNKRTLEYYAYRDEKRRLAAIKKAHEEKLERKRQRAERRAEKEKRKQETAEKLIKAD